MCACTAATLAAPELIASLDDRVNSCWLLQRDAELDVKRFYVTLILYALWRQQPVWRVAEKFRQTRGFVQQLLASAAAFAACVARFCAVSPAFL